MLGAPRFHFPAPLYVGTTIRLPSGAARHVQVLRLQPGDEITLFGGAVVDPTTASEGTAAIAGGEFRATIAAIGRSEVQVLVGHHDPVEREASRKLQLAIGMPANERMDWLVEKATELGVSSIQPLMTERSVVRLDGERARKKTAHWQSIAIAACEQCGRNRVPEVRLATTLTAWIGQFAGVAANSGPRLVLSLRAGALPLRQTPTIGQWPDGEVTLLSGPEGGFGKVEEDSVIGQGFVPMSLGTRVFRSETAALAALTLLA